MAELSNEINQNKRVVFPQGKQKEFLEKARLFLGLKNKKFAELMGISVRTLNDWKREKFYLSLSRLKFLCDKLGVFTPKYLEIKDAFWYTSLGAHKGGVASFKKYGCIGGDPEYRKEKWYEWWQNKGRFRKDTITSPIKVIKPPKSNELAEFVGILLGDGAITKKQITVTLHKIDDGDFTEYVCHLIEKLFHLKPAIYKRESVNNIVISRTELVKFFVYRLGLCVGNKVRQQVDVPTWIKKSEVFSKACLRGLFDTDGCFYIDKHKYNRKTYLNCGINFTNRALPLLFFFKETLQKYNLSPTQKTKYAVFLRREEDILKYFNEIGSSNPKHYRKFRDYFINKYGEVPKWS
ncbi:MAG: LAGLIDADG family homing endonuclease [Candidatus Taylorbacteria bacterium]|nr:LAGLIDADG family homing endonuclease [Candidatus Taylorbacteria bacterium]